MSTPTNQPSGEMRPSMGPMNQGIGSPISNEAYNVIAALHATLEGLESYRKYAQDGGQIWQQVAQHDLKAADLLVQELERMVQSNQLRMRQPGQTQ